MRRGSIEQVYGTILIYLVVVLVILEGAYSGEDSLIQSLSCCFVWNLIFFGFLLPLWSEEFPSDDGVFHSASFAPFTSDFSSTSSDDNLIYCKGGCGEKIEPVTYYFSMNEDDTCDWCNRASDELGDS